MKNYIFLIFAMVLACKTAKTHIQVKESSNFDIIATRDFDFLKTGSSIDLGGITLTKLDGAKAVLVRPEKTSMEQSTGTTNKIKDKSKTEININSGNKDKSRITENSNNKDKSRGDLDKSRVKVKVPGLPFLRTLFIFVLLAIGAIWFFYPRIKRFLKPPGL